MSRLRPLRRLLGLDGVHLTGTRYLVLLTTLVTLFVLTPFTAAVPGRLLWLRLFFFVLLLATVLAATASRRLFRIALALVLAPVIINGLVLADERFRQPHLLVFASFFALVAGAVLYDVLRPGEVTGDKILGAICVYLFAGLVWAFLYSFFDAGGASEAIRFSNEGSAGTFDDHVYFSFVTLTTLGYGDVVPVSPPVRTLAILEAIFGQLYLAVLVARLVGLHISSRAGRE